MADDNLSAAFHEWAAEALAWSNLTGYAAFEAVRDEGADDD